jgi:hypothetical protein
MGIREVFGDKRAAVLEVGERHGARSLYVFGSVARGEEGEHGDVDLLVELVEGRTLLDLGSLLMDLQDLLGRNVDVVELGGLHPSMRARILSEAVPL